MKAFEFSRILSDKMKVKDYGSKSIVVYPVTNSPLLEVRDIEWDDELEAFVIICE